MTSGNQSSSSHHHELDPWTRLQGHHSSNANSNINWSPLPWSDYFTSFKDITVTSQVETVTFRVYFHGPKPLLEPTLVADTSSSSESSLEALFLLIHGAGHSSLSWAIVAKNLIDRFPKSQVMAMDFRGHGASSLSDISTSLTLTQLANDVVDVLFTHYGSKPTDYAKHVIIVGHSLGGAVAVELASRQCIPNVLGVVVLDVVEGTAVESLSTMRSILHRRPSSFNTIEDAIRWSFESGNIRNIQSARISVPSQLKLDDSRKQYTWTTNLFATEPHWHGWFAGLSSKFLKCKCVKLLLLAGADRLERDRELTIGQMQGKFQVQFFHTGHSIQEDAPDEVVDILSKFVERYTQPIRPLRPINDLPTSSHDDRMTNTR